MSESTRVMLNNVRLAFPVLDEPEQFQGSGKPRYSAVLLVEPGSENDKKIDAALRTAAGEQWGEANIEAALKSIKATNKCAYRDGGTKEYDGFEGMMALSAHAQAGAPPSLLDGRKKHLPRNTGMIYAGCYVNASVEIWTLDKKKGYGNQLNCQLRGVQFSKDGDAFTAARPADSDEFNVVEGAAADNGDFGNDEADGNQFA
jgi:hypothetical protein